MKKNYILLLIAILFLGMISAQETQKNFINYQGVARNASNELMAGEIIAITIGLKFGTANSSSVYEENHSITTDANGVFSLLIGNGSAVNGTYNTLPWGSAATFVTITMNGNEIGTTEMMAVPYAISSGDASQNAMQVAYDNSTSTLTATNTQAAIDELATGGTDADADPTNEIQTLSFDVATNELSLSDGGIVTIPSGGTDADADPTNEIQTISFDAVSNKISLTDGGEITIPSGGTDADADPTNELQDISLSGTDLSISDGSTIDLSAILPPGGTDDQNATEVPFDNTASGLAAANTQAAIDELATSGLVDTDDQDLSLSGTMLQITGGTGVDLAPIIAPGGTDDQNLVLTGDVLSIENGTGTVDLSAYAGDDADADPTNEIDVTAEKGILTGDGTSVSGLVGTADGQVVKWNDAIGNWEAGTDATGGTASSLWIEDASGVNSGASNVGIGVPSNRSVPLDISHAGSLSMKLSTTFSKNKIAFNTSGGYIGYVGVDQAWGGMDIGTSSENTNGTVNLTIGGVHKLTVAANGKVGIGTRTPKSVLDVKGGNNWNLKTTEGDFRIGNDTHRLKMGIALGGTGAGSARIRAEGGVDRLTLGAGDKDVLAITPESVNMIGDFANQGMYQVTPLKDTWIPPSGIDRRLVQFPDAILDNVKVPAGSKVLLGFVANGVIDSDNIAFVLYRDGYPIFSYGKGCYEVAGSRERWSFSFTYLDINVSPGTHKYNIEVRHSDDPEDCTWYSISFGADPNNTFYAIVLKE